MSTVTIRKPIRLSTGVFTDAELDYFDSLGEDYFPSEETKRVGETEWHYLSISTAFQMLRHVFPDPSDVYIAADLFLYWDRTQKGQVLAPDLFVVKGAGRRLRSSYKLWEEEGRTPNVVIEVASEETGKQDLGLKMEIYEQVLKVPEYFLFDPTGKIYPARLQGFRLEQGVYQPIALVDGRLPSVELGLELVSEGILLRFYDPVRGVMIPTVAEVEARAEAEATGRRQAEVAPQQAEARAELEMTAWQVERTARQQAEAENARLRAEIESLRARSQPEK